jgi:hypothetical protein
MICYKDMTFCPYYPTCTLGNVCNRALTPEVSEAAARWWTWFNCNGDAMGAPIARYTSEPGCYVAIRN